MDKNSRSEAKMLEAGSPSIQYEPQPSTGDEGGETPAPKNPEDFRDAQLSKRYRMMNFWQKYILELTFMFYAFASIITMIPQTQIFLEKACDLNLNYNQTICLNITDKANKASYVESAKITKVYGLIRDVVTTVPAFVSSVIAGQYMTRYGSRAPLILAILGSMVTSGADLYTFHDTSLPLYVNILTAIPQALTGGFIILMTAVFTNITVSCPSEEKKKRFLMIQFFMFLPMVIAVSVGGTLMQKFGVLILAAVTFFGYLVSLVIVVFIYKDAGVSESAKEESLRDAWRHSTSLDMFRTSLSYLSRKRPGHAKGQIVCMFICLMTGIMAFTGTSDLDQLYVTGTFGWSSSTYGFVKSIVMVITFVLAVPTMFILTKLKFSDPMLVVIGYGSFVIKSCLTSVLFLGVALFIIPSIVGLPFIVGLTAVRSHLSRLLEQHEVPVIFSLTSACERLVPVFADLLLTAIYTETSTFFQGLVYLVEGLLFLIPMGVALWCYKWTKIEGYPDYEKLENEKDETE